MNISLLKFDALPSTNSEAVAQAKRGANEGVCIVAREQTAGRGRRGRGWKSSIDTGLYFSIVLRPQFSRDRYPLISLMAAIAVFDLLKEEFGIRPDIKWPNDVLAGDRKICGILAEVAETKTGTAVILGIGINARKVEVAAPRSLQPTSVSEETGKDVAPDEMLAGLTRRLSKHYFVLASDPGVEETIEQWARRSSYFRNKEVETEINGSTVEGITDGLESNGALRIKVGDAVEVVEAGDVFRLRGKT